MFTTSKNVPQKVLWRETFSSAVLWIHLIPEHLTYWVLAQIDQNTPGLCTLCLLHGVCWQGQDSCNDLDISLTDACSPTIKD